MKYLLILLVLVFVNSSVTVAQDAFDAPEQYFLRKGENNNVALVDQHGIVIRAFYRVMQVWQTPERKVIIFQDFDGLYGVIDVTDGVVVDQGIPNIIKFNKYGYSAIKIDSHWAIIDIYGNKLTGFVYDAIVGNGLPDRNGIGAGIIEEKRVVINVNKPYTKAIDSSLN